ncbi:MAG: hypothetical protein KC621_10715 [Myxococcales bacterium]|nr:hypothetical protein [Myxococcales bacterium]
MTTDLATLEKTKKLSIRCPYCVRDGEYELPDLQGRYSFSCTRCTKPFMTKVMVVRAKSGRQNKKEDQRELKLRGKYPDGREDHIILVKAGTEDIEARSGDLIAMSYRIESGKAVLPVVLYNYNIGKHWFITAPGGCGCAAAVMLVVLATASAVFLTA